MAILEPETETLQDRNYRQTKDRNIEHANNEFDAVNKRIDNLGSQNYPGASEVGNARTDMKGKRFKSLSGRLDSDQGTAESAYKQIKSKASKDYVDDQITKLIPGTPQGTFTNLADLKKAYPNGDTGIYVTTYDGNWNYWDGSDWKVGGVYQSPINPDLSKLEDRSKLNQLNLEPVHGQRLGGSKNDGTVNTYPVSDSAYTIIKSSEILGEVLAMPLMTFDQGQFLILTDSKDKVLKNFGWKAINQLADGKYSENELPRFINVKNGYVYLFIKHMQAYYSFSKLYLGFPDKEKPSAFYLNSISTQDYAPWLKQSKLSLLTKKVYAKVSVNYDVSTRHPNYSRNNGFNIYYFDLSSHKTGTLTIPRPHAVQNSDGSYYAPQFAYRMGSDGRVIDNMGYSDETGYPKLKDNSYIKEKGDELVFDLAKADASQLILILPSPYCLGFYEKYEGVFNIDEVEPSVKLETSNLKSEDFNLPEYVPVTSGEDQYIYFDGLVKNKNIYNNEITATSKNMLDDHVVINDTSDGAVTITFNESDDVSISYKVVPKKITGKYKILAIGESTTQADTYMTGLRDYLTDSGADFTFLGSRSTRINNVPMEAYSGWGAGTLRYVAEAGNYKNEFYNPKIKMFDYDYYLKQHPDQEVPDVCLINFGINPTNRYTNPVQTTSQNENIQYIINQIKAKNSKCVFVVGLTHYCSRWSNYWADPSARREGILEGVENIIKDFGNRENEYIYLNPMYLSLDPRWDMQYKEIQPNRNDDSRRVLIGTDNHHPSTIGYKNNAYSTVNAIKYAILN